MTHPQHPDLDTLEARQLRQLQRLYETSLLDRPRPSTRFPARRPEGNAPLIDQARSIGACTAFLDLNSVTIDVTGARGGAGFNADVLERALAEGAFDATTVSARLSPNQLAEDASRRLEAALRKTLKLNSDHHIAFTATSGEALQLTILGTAQPGTSLLFVGDPPPDFSNLKGSPLLTTFTSSDPGLIRDACRQRPTICMASPSASDPEALGDLIELRALTRTLGVPLVLDARAATWRQLLSWISIEPDGIAAFLPGGPGVTVATTLASSKSQIDATTLIRAQILTQQAIPAPHTEHLRKSLKGVTDAHPKLEVVVDGHSARLRCHDVWRCDQIMSRATAAGLLLRRTGEKSLAMELPSDCAPALIDRITSLLRASLSGLSPKGSFTEIDPQRQRHVRIRAASPEEADALVPAIMALEAKIFEPARRDSDATLRAAFIDPYGSSVVAEAASQDGAETWELVGYALGVSLERVDYTDGPNIDVMLHRGNTLYSIAISVDPEMRGLGLGRKLKVAQLKHARTITNEDGTRRFRFATGRNRVGATQAMTRINRSLGGHTVAVLSAQYGEPDAQALYYRITLDGPTLRPQSTHLNLSDGIETVLASPPEKLIDLARQNVLAGPLINGIDLEDGESLTCRLARRWLSAMAPAGSKLRLTTSQASAMEVIFDSLSTLRPEAVVGIGLRGGFFGETTLRTCALSDIEPHPGSSLTERWPMLPHPSAVSTQELQAALELQIKAAGGAEKILGVFVELVQIQTGRHLVGESVTTLLKCREETGIPIIVVESASAFYRSSEATFASSKWAQVPDVITWSAGQVAAVHSKLPLTDDKRRDRSRGGELPLLRLHLNLMGLRKVDVSAARRALSRALELAERMGMSSSGTGLYHLLDAGARTSRLVKALAQRSVESRTTEKGQLIIAPALDAARELSNRLTAALTSLE